MQRGISCSEIYIENVFVFFLKQLKAKRLHLANGSRIEPGVFVIVLDSQAQRIPSSIARIINRDIQISTDCASAMAMP